MPLSKNGQQSPLASALEGLPKAVSEKAENRFLSLLEGISIYQAAAYARGPEEAPVVWRQGAARLLACYPDKPKAGTPTVLFIPSLINRYYILDLSPQRSLMRFLARQGITSLVLDWGTPGEQEAAYDNADYVRQVLLPALRFINDTSGEPVVLAGYCMGGVFALAAALLEPERAKGLALFATPWDFHVPDVHTPRLDAAGIKQFEELLEAEGMLPPAQLQLLFYWHDPWLFSRKFSQFAELKPGSPAFRAFIELEHWVNDGVPLAKGVAHDCLIGWGQRNVLAKNQWSVAGRKMDPTSLTIPAFAAVPTQDRIVPSACAMPLAKAIKGCTLVEPGAGHVGMIVGSRSKAELWAPFHEWLMLQCST